MSTYSIHVLYLSQFTPFFNFHPRGMRCVRKFEICLFAGKDSLWSEVEDKFYNMNNLSQAIPIICYKIGVCKNQKTVPFFIYFCTSLNKPLPLLFHLHLHHSQQHVSRNFTPLGSGSKNYLVFYFPAAFTKLKIFLLMMLCWLFYSQLIKMHLHSNQLTKGDLTLLSCLYEIILQNLCRHLWFENRINLLYKWVGQTHSQLES